MSKILLSKETHRYLADKIKNNKLVKLLNHKMFKGYRDIKASKLFYKKNLTINKNTLGCMEWEKKVYDYYEDLYNLNYKYNVLTKLHTPAFSNVVHIKHFPSKINNEPKTTLSNFASKIKKTKSSLNTYASSNQNITTLNSLSQKDKIQTNSNNNFYLTSMSIYHTDNFYHKYNPEKVIKEIFDKDNVYYNDIPILSLTKINKYNNSKKPKKFKFINSDDDIIPSDNIHDNLYAGLTERQFLYKISHNKLDKNIQEKINVNSFIKNKGVVKLTDIRRLKSALWKSKKRPNLLNQIEKGPKNINIDLKINNLGELEMNQIISTNISNTKQEILFDKQNQYLVYNSGVNTDISSASEYKKNRPQFSGFVETNANKIDKIFGDPFKNLKNDKNKEPKIGIFQNKPRIFNDKLMVNYQLVKKNQFNKLKNIMT